MVLYGLVGTGDGGVDIVVMLHFKLPIFGVKCDKSSVCGPLITMPSRFCRFRRRDLIDSTRRRNALAPSFKRSLPVRRKRTGSCSSSCDFENDTPIGSVEYPNCSSSLASFVSGLDSRDVSNVLLLSWSIGFCISISPTRDQRRPFFVCWMVQFSLNAYSSSSDSSLFCGEENWKSMN